MNCVLYARVSTDKQAEKELSIPAQLQAMRDYSSRQGWSVLAEFIEPGASARTTERPALQQLLATVRADNPKVDVVLVHKIDRLARNVYDHATIRALLKHHGVRLASVVENVDESVSGELVENIMASIAQFYSANLGEEVKKGMRQKVLNGGWPHLAPCGYVQVRGEGAQESHIEVHPRIGPLISECFERGASGLYSPRQLVRWLADRGVRSKSGGPISSSHLRNLLRNSFYAGRIRWNGLDVAAKHQPLVTQELFDKVQRVLNERFRQRGRKGSLRGVPLRGLAICAACRGHMTAERHERWLYYRCSRQVYRRELCPARFCNAEQAHADLKRICLQIQISRDVARSIAKSARQVIEARMESGAKDNDELAAAAKGLLLTEMQLTEAFAAGDLNAAEYASKAEETYGQRLRLSAREKLMKQDPRQTLLDLERILTLATSLWDMYEPLTDRQRAQLLRVVFATVTLGSQGIVGFSLTIPFKALQQHGPEAVTQIAEQLIAVSGNNICD